jgi:hypothetical protein
MRHFNYFENGGPFPGTCISCGANKHLYDVQGTRVNGGSNLLCRKCVGELALFTGYAEEAPYEEAAAKAMQRITDLEQELSKIPDHVEDLINGIRSRVTDFVFAVSYGDSISNAESAEKPELSVEQSDEHAQRQHADASSRNKPARK